MTKALFNNIVFIGGIHGVGKSTVCRTICEETGLIHLSASEVLKWEEINHDMTNKTVTDVVHTQDRLINGLTGIVNGLSKYLLDGHYCLLEKDGAIKKIPIETFIKINPFSLNLIVDDISLIKKRLEKRDGKQYDANLLNEMQNSEVSYAKEVSNILNVELNICNSQEIAAIINPLKQHL